MTPRSLGYVTIKFAPTFGKSIKIELAVRQATGCIRQYCRDHWTTGSAVVSNRRRRKLSGSSKQNFTHPILNEALKNSRRDFIGGLAATGALANVGFKRNQVCRKD
jgi:hypothetical protein